MKWLNCGIYWKDCQICRERLIFLSCAYTPATCAERCYASGSQGGCYCDSACSFFGDCCSNFDALCMRSPVTDSPGIGQFVF